MNRILKTATEKDELLAAMVAKPTTMPQWVTCFVADENKNYILNAVANTATEVVEVVSTATQENFVLAEDITAPCPVRGRSDGKVEKYNIGESSVGMTPITTGFYSNTKGQRLYKLDTDKFLMSIGYSGQIIAVKNVDGVISTGDAATDLGNDVMDILPLTATTALVLYRDNAVIVTVDFSDLTITAGTPSSISGMQTSYTPYQSGGILKLSSTTAMAYFPLPTGTMGKALITFSGTSISSVGASVDLGSGYLASSTYTWTMDRTTEDAAVFIRGVTSTGIIGDFLFGKFYKISATETAEVVDTIFRSNMTNPLYDQIEKQFAVLSSSKTVIGYCGGAGDGYIVPASFMVANHSGDSVSYSPLAVPLTDVILSAGDGSELLFKLIRCGNNKFAVLYLGKSGDVIMDLFDILSDNTVVLVGSSTVPQVTFVKMTAVASFSTDGGDFSDTYTLAVIKDTTITSQGWIVKINFTQQGEYIGVLKESGTTGETKPVVLEGGVLGGIAGASFTPAKKVYYDVAAETLNQTSGFEIGVAIKSNSIKLK